MTEKSGMDWGGVAATHIVLDYHKRLKGLFIQYNALDMRESTLRDAVCRQILMEAEIHSKIDQDLLYPAIQACCDEDGRRRVASAFAEHQPILEWVDKIRELNKEGHSWDTEMESLIEVLETHLETESREIIPLAEESIPIDQMGSLGMRIQLHKINLEQEPEYADSRPEVTQNPNGGEQMRGRHPDEDAA